MIFLVTWVRNGQLSINECSYRTEAIDVIRNILEEGDIAFESISVYEAYPKLISLGIED